jgi:uncharacterized protein (TIGR02246 family)
VSGGPAAARPGPLAEGSFAAWLERYKTAWEAGDTDRAASLFAPDAVYAETPFAAPLQGREAIRAYWRAGAQQAQRDILFRYRIEAVAGAIGICHWRCTFTRVGNGERVELDGIFRCAIDAAGLCTRFDEWWHRRTLGPAASA